MAISVPFLLEAFQAFWLSSIKPEQLQVVAGILKGDVFAILPTGFGKSVCYQCLPLLFVISKAKVILPGPSFQSLCIQIAYMHGL